MNICRLVGISVATYHQWRRKYGGRSLGAAPSEGVGGRECHALTDGRRAVTEYCCAQGRNLPNILRPTQKGEAVHVLTHEHVGPLRLSCHCAGSSRAAWITALSHLVDAHPHWEFWILFMWLRKRHVHWNYKRICRVYKAMTLHLKRAAKRRLPKREGIAFTVP